MKDLQTAIAAWLAEASGVRTVCGRSPVRGDYPLYSLEVEQKSSVLLAGGRLAEQTYTVTVRAVSDRERTGTTVLLAALPPLLLGGIPLLLDDQRRTLHPLRIRTQGEELTFTLELCVSLDGSAGGSANGEKMQTLELEV